MIASFQMARLLLLIALSIGLVIAISFEFVLRMVRSRIIDMTGKKIDVVLAANIFEHVLAVKMAQRPTSVGVLANQLREFDSVREFFTSGSVVSAIDLLFAVLFVACSIHDCGTPGVDSARDAADHDCPWACAAASAGPCNEQPAGGIGGSARRPGGIACPASRPCAQPAPKPECRGPGRGRWRPPPGPARMCISGRRWH